MRLLRCILLFFFNDTATTEIYTLSLHDALPIYPIPSQVAAIFRANEHSPTVKKLIDQIVRSPEVHRSEEHTSELQSPDHLVCRLLLEKKKKFIRTPAITLRIPIFCFTMGDRGGA